jgi:uncharacterized protein (DUF2252 family)
MVKVIDKVVDRIYTFNQGRDPKLLKLKYKAMRADVFAFYRGTCHLFYEDLPLDSPLNNAPPAWICGDLHLENFGTYKGDNRLVYFDINDFDEASLAPCTWDVTRLSTSIIVGAETLGVEESQTLNLCQTFLTAYRNTLAQGQARTVETETAKGLVKDLLNSLKLRNRPDFLDRHTELKKGKRRLIIDNKRVTEATKDQQQRVIDSIENWQKDTHQNDKFFQILDVQQRIAGTGSLGVERYVVLVEGKGSPDNNFLLDFKQSRKSSLQPYLTLPQPHWENQADRVVAIQKRVQGTSPALLGVVKHENHSYVLRELQPVQDKVCLNAWEGKIGRLEKLMRTMGEVTAWDHLRSSGRQGSAIADELIEFAHKPDWNDQVLDYARSYAERVQVDYRLFREGE